MDSTQQLKLQLEEFLRGGFAPNLILLQEFDHKKAAILLDGLHFSAWILLGHMRERQRVLLNFIKDPENISEVWEDAHWPENHQPESREEWLHAIEGFSEELEEVIMLIKQPDIDLFSIQPNGKSIHWAAMAVLHHNAYHIGQLKTVGRQVGVW